MSIKFRQLMVAGVVSFAAAVPAAFADAGDSATLARIA